MHFFVWSHPFAGKGVTGELTRRGRRERKQSVFKKVTCQAQVMAMADCFHCFEKYILTLVLLLWLVEGPETAHA